MTQPPAPDEPDAGVPRFLARAADQRLENLRERSRARRSRAPIPPDARYRRSSAGRSARADATAASSVSRLSSSACRRPSRTPCCRPSSKPCCRPSSRPPRGPSRPGSQSLFEALAVARSPCRRPGPPGGPPDGPDPCQRPAPLRGPHGGPDPCRRPALPRRPPGCPDLPGGQPLSRPPAALSAGGQPFLVGLLASRRHGSFQSAGRLACRAVARFRHGVLALRLAPRRQISSMTISTWRSTAACRRSLIVSKVRLSWSSKVMDSYRSSGSGRSGRSAG